MVLEKAKWTFSNVYPSEKSQTAEQVSISIKNQQHMSITSSEVGFVPIVVGVIRVDWKSPLANVWNTWTRPPSAQTLFMQPLLDVCSLQSRNLSSWRNWGRSSAAWLSAGSILHRVKPGGHSGGERRHTGGRKIRWGRSGDMSVGKLLLSTTMTRRDYSNVNIVTCIYIATHWMIGKLKV